MRRHLVLMVLVSALAASVPGRAMPQPQGGATLTPAVRADVIERTAAALVSTYIELDGGAAIADQLRKKLAAGGYDTVQNPAQFAEVVTTDMRRRNGDLHLGLQFAPPAGPAAAGPPLIPAARNFGIGSVQILDGNIGYLEVTAFAASPGYRDVIDGALRFLERTDAIIIDVRRNGGGSSEMSHYLFSHFLDGPARPTIRVLRRDREPTTAMSMGSVGGPRRPDVPLYVLTSRGSASAAEEFAFVLRNQKRATIVGTRTAGAGRMVAGVAVGHGFTARISITRVFDAGTGIEWEGEGIEPHLAVPPAEALVAAHEAALTVLETRAPDPARARLLESLAALRRPAATSADLRQWAGTYGDRVVSLSLRDGSLWYARRDGALPERLVPLADGRYALGAIRFMFEVVSGGVRLTIEQPNGTTVQFDRGGVRS